MHASVSAEYFDFPRICCKHDKECCGAIAFLKRALHGLSASAAPDAATIEAAQLPLSEDAPEATAQALQISVEERAAVGLALYRSGARAALKDAISATQAMVDDSAPLSEAHTAVSSVSLSAKLLSTATVVFMSMLLSAWATRVGIHQHRCVIVTGVSPCDQACRSTRCSQANWLVDHPTRGMMTPFQQSVYLGAVSNSCRFTGLSDHRPCRGQRPHTCGVAAPRS